MAAVLWTSCLALLATACADKQIAIPLKPDATRLVCVSTTTRPTIPGEYVIDWTKVASIPAAKAEHEKYVASIRTREGVIAGYIVQVEGQLFTCSNNMQWLRDYYAKLPDGK